MGVEPIQVAAEPAKAKLEVLDKNGTPIREVRFGLFDGAFEGVPDAQIDLRGSNDYDSPQNRSTFFNSAFVNFIDGDSQAFFFRLTTNPGFAKTSVRILWGTKSDFGGGKSVKDTRGITLTRKEPGRYESPMLLLVSDRKDLEIKVHPGVEESRPKKKHGEEEYRLRFSVLHGLLFGAYTIPRENGIQRVLARTGAVVFDPKHTKTVTVELIVFRKRLFEEVQDKGAPFDGRSNAVIPCFRGGKLWRLYTNLVDCYRRIGIKVVTQNRGTNIPHALHGVRYLMFKGGRPTTPRAFLVDPPILNPEADPRFQKRLDPYDVTDTVETKNLHEAIPPLPGVIRVFFVGELTGRDRSGRNVLPRAEIARAHSRTTQHIAISATRVRPYTMAHEVCHVLTGGIGPARGHYEFPNPDAKSRFPTGQNLLRSSSSLERPGGTPALASKRLWDVAGESAPYTQQITRIHGSGFSK